MLRTSTTVVLMLLILGMVREAEQPPGVDDTSFFLVADDIVSEIAVPRGSGAGADKVGGSCKIYVSIA